MQQIKRLFFSDLGRIGRTTYAVGIIGVLVAYSITVGPIAYAISMSGIPQEFLLLTAPFGATAIYAFFALTTKRSHDFETPGLVWVVLILATSILSKWLPFVSIALLLCMLALATVPGSRATNRFGDPPKAVFSIGMPAGAIDKTAMRRMYDWTLSLAARKSAEAWLAIIAFIESSIFLVPADVLFLPMALSRPERAYRYALVATLASTLGGIAGYALGALAYEAAAKPILEFYHKLDEFERLRACGGYETTLVLLVTSGLFHLPPIKVVTILSGVLHVGLAFFILSCVIARGARFFALAWALQRYGKRIKSFIEERLALIAAVAAVVLIALYFAVRILAGSGMITACF